VPRIVLGFAALAALVQPCVAGDTSTTVEMLIRLNVRPAAAPRPALRYRLLPELAEINPGNPVLHYMKSMMERKKFFFDEEAFRDREKLLSMPLKELPVQELEDYGRYALAQADWAARLDHPDWQALLKLKSEGYSLLLPEVQQIRSLARALQVRFRAEIAQCRFDDAIRTAKTMFAMARHLGEHPTLIGNLVGMAVASMTTSHVEEMLEQPGCPNLFWALSSLPCPLVSMDRGTDGERAMLAWVFRDLDASAPMNKDQIQKFIVDKDKLLEIGEGKPDKPGVRAWLDARIKDDTVVAAARRRLVDHGLSEDRLTRLPADQVILLDEKRELEVRVDDELKTVSFPLWQVEPRDPGVKVKKPPSLFAEALTPVVDSVRMAQGRIDQRLHLLRHIEALRLHAAEHGGVLPAQLSDMALPLPVDPVTGKPFRYELIGTTAHLRGTPPRAQAKVPQFNIHYEISVQP
jgi:hypothetical protein